VALLAKVAPARAQETALATLRAEARASRNDPAVARRLGLALLRAGRYREAEAQLRVAARLARSSPESLFDVARVAFAQGDYRRAQAACRALARPPRGSAEPPLVGRVCMARAFLVWNRSSRAFEELEAVLAASPNDVEALLALGDAHRLRADVPAAESAYRRAAAAAPARPEPYLGLGRLYTAAGRRDEAVAALQEALRRDGDDPEIQLELGRLLGGTADARALLASAVAGRPGWAEAQVALGEAQLAAGEVAAAVASFEAALRADARSATAHTGLGRARALQGDLAGAEASLRRALELVPNAPETARALAAVLGQKEDYEGAFEQYRHAADLDPRNPQALRDAAALALQVRRDVLAAGFLDRLLEAHPDDPEGLALYGDVMVARSDRAAARRYYERALRAGGGPRDRARVEQALRALGPAAPAAPPPGPARR
jgi:tetratricopeptide (TPR) repeat protein